MEVKAGVRAEVKVEKAVVRAEKAEKEGTKGEKGKGKVAKAGA